MSAQSSLSNKLSIKKGQYLLEVVVENEQFQLKVRNLSKEGQQNSKAQKKPMMFNQEIKKQHVECYQQPQGQVNHLMKISYIAKFTYENLPSECHSWFENLRELFEAFSDQKDVEVVELESTYQVRLIIDITSCGKSFRRYCKFPLELVEQLEQLEQENLVENRENNIYSMDEKTAHKNLQSYFQRLSESINKVNQNLTGIQKYDSAIQQMQKFIQEGFIAMNTRLDNVVNQIYRLKQGELKLKLKVRQLSFVQSLAHIPESKLTMIRPNYTFSQNHKNQSVELLSQTRAASFAKDKSFKCAFVNPASFEIGNNFHCHYFELQLKIKKLAKYISFGICEKNVIKANKFRSSQQSVKDHGFYVADWHGQVWNTYLESETTLQPIKGLRFFKNDVVKMVFRTNKKKLVFYKNGNEKCTVTINPSIPLNNLCFVVVLCGDSDEVEIISRENREKLIDLENNWNGQERQVIQL